MRQARRAYQEKALPLSTIRELAYCYCYVPDGQPVSLPRLVRAAGCRWPVEEDFRSGNMCA